jgi:hypothetical protein
VRIGCAIVALLDAHVRAERASPGERHLLREGRCRAT